MVDPTAAIRAKSEHWRWRMPEYARFSDLSDSLLARHRRETVRWLGEDIGGVCSSCYTGTNVSEEAIGCEDWPCPDIRALADAWGVDDDVSAQTGATPPSQQTSE